MSIAIIRSFTGEGGQFNRKVRIAKDCGLIPILVSINAPFHGEPPCEMIQFLGPTNDALAERLSEITDLLAVVPMSDWDVQLCDYLSDKLTLRGNPMKYSPYRFNKYLMQERVKNVGLRGILQKECSRIDEIRSFVEQSRCSGGYVIKPLESCATVDVYFCESLAELEVRYRKITEETSCFGTCGKSALVQEFIEGEEWVVNTASRNGLHKVVGVYRYKKRRVNGRAFVYQSMRLVDSSQLDPSLIAYTLNVLNALEIQNGAGHAEIMMTDTGPCLIEMNARNCGGDSQVMLRKCIGYSHAETQIWAYACEEKFNSLPCIYPSTARVGLNIDLICLYDSVVWRRKYLKDLIVKLNRFVSVDEVRCPIDGELLYRTIDGETIISDLYISSVNAGDFDIAEALALEWEQNLIQISADQTPKSPNSEVSSIPPNGV